MRPPDGRLVYLHCASIFKGSNAQLRRPKKVLQVLEGEKKSIKVLTRDFSLQDIALVAKQLLEEGIFESTSRARLHFPELFEQSISQEAEREAFEAEATRIESEAVNGTAALSDDEDEMDAVGNEEDNGTDDEDEIAIIVDDGNLEEGKAKEKIDPASSFADKSKQMLVGQRYICPKFPCLVKDESNQRFVN